MTYNTLIYELNCRLYFPNSFIFSKGYVALLGCTILQELLPFCQVIQRTAKLIPRFSTFPLA